MTTQPIHGAGGATNRPLTDTAREPDGIPIRMAVAFRHAQLCRDGLTSADAMYRAQEEYWIDRLTRARLAVALATDEADQLATERDAALSRVGDLEAQLDHLAEILIGRERYVAVLHARWRRVRAGRPLRARLVRLRRSLRHASRAVLSRLAVAGLVVLLVGTFAISIWSGLR